MADMYGSILSNTFKVKDIQKFKAWFEGYYFGDDIEQFIDEDERTVCFGSQAEQYPSIWPRKRDDDGDWIDTDIYQFARELCEQLVEGEIFNVVAGGNEKLRYVSFGQIIIAQERPDKPYYEHYSSDDDNDRLIKLVLTARRD